MPSPDAPSYNPSARKPRVAVLGTGLMGSAIARTLLNNDYVVSVWNRTSTRCDPLRELGALTPATAEGAIRDSDVIILMMLDYSAALTLLADASKSLYGKTIVNLITGTAADADEVDTWVKEHGADYLDGIVAAYPDDIGKTSTLFYYAGDPEAWTRCRPMLLSLAGAATYIGSGSSAANVLDAAMTATFHTVSIGAFLEGMSYARSAGVDLNEIKRTLPYWMDLLSQEISTALDDVLAGSHSTDQATVETYLVALRTIRESMVGAGERAHLLTAAVDNLERVHSAGHGEEALSAQILTARISTPQRSALSTPHDLYARTLK